MNFRERSWWMCNPMVEYWAIFWIIKENVVYYFKPGLSRACLYWFNILLEKMNKAIWQLHWRESTQPAVTCSAATTIGQLPTWTCQWPLHNPEPTVSISLLPELEPGDMLLHAFIQQKNHKALISTAHGIYIIIVVKIPLFYNTAREKHGQFKNDRSSMIICNPISEMLGGESAFYIPWNMPWQVHCSGIQSTKTKV